MNEDAATGEDTVNTPAAAPRARRRWPFVVAVALAGLVLLLVATLAWVAATPAGTRAALRLASEHSGGRFAATPAAGTLLGPLTLTELRYVDAAAGLDLRIGRLQLDWTPRALLAGRLQVESLDLQRVLVHRTEPAEPTHDAPLSLEPPLDLSFERVSLRDAVLLQDGAERLRITEASARLAWDRAGVHIERLDVVAPEGELHFAATLDREAGLFTGRAEGRFRWQAGTRRIAGTIAGRTRETLGELELQLAEPLAAELRLGLEQHARLPWRFMLDVPAFDPRERLLPDSALTRLAAHLEGRGDLDGGTASGTLHIDDTEVALQPLRIARRGDDLTLDATLLGRDGRLHAAGELLLSRQPLEARLDLDWRDVVLPATLAGQPLHSRGTARLEGSVERYAARASFAAGPPRRLADVRLALTGDRAGLVFQRLDITQAAGRLAAQGELGFGEALRWRAEAQARDFDPGALLAGWPGRLSFALASEGRLADAAGTTATLRIDDLRGRLRGRSVAGRADLRLSPGTLPSGSMDLRSGASRVRVEGARGDRLDAVLRLEVPDLDDWLPGGRGRLDARVDASGRWPELAITGRASGRELAFGATSAGSLDLTLDLLRPLEPRGEARLVLRDLRTGDAEASTVELRATGAAAAHRVELELQGRPLSTALAFSGALDGTAWRGEVERLVVDATGLARLELERPVRVAWTGATRAFELQTACLADGDIRLCLEGRGLQGGALQAGYELQRLPLGLLAALAPTALPVTIEGRIDGRGRIERDAEGRLQGEAHLLAASGRISLAGTEDGEAAQRLLDYRDLRLDAAFAGRDARATLTAALDERGSIDAGLTAAGLGEARTTLEGRLRASVPSLAVIGAFAPQLADVDGRLRLDLDVGGTLDEPLLGGSGSIEDFTADVPELGIALRAGRLRLAPQPDGRLLLEGGLRSGDGELSVAGTAQRDGQAQARVTGRNFLAADRPGARVSISPDLEVRSTDGRLEVTGKVAIPAAQIDLQRLPRGDRAQSASPDVVVIDDPARDESAAGTLPLFATVDVELGDAVDLTGFGLAARVAGGLRISESPGQITTASGEIRVSGRYKAYGQDLTIRQGQLLYAAMPLDDPNLNIVAVRVIDAVTAGLRVTGRARTPQLEVFSDPAMGQANALAWLVTGKPLEAIGQGDAEGDALQSAARSLGTAAGGLLARSVGRRLGVDELGITDDATLGGAALTIGQYLSPRVFVSYGVGLFKPGEVVKLVYRISDSLALEAQNATESSRIGVQYRVEK